jgi:hypothetical protein
VYSSTRVDYDVGDSPVSVFSADLDGDSCNDIVVANSQSDNLSILSNNGDGTFQAAVSLAAGDGPRSAFAIDLDGDSDHDLVTANELANTVSILINNGDGSFQAAVEHAVGASPFSVYSADLEGDYDNDLVTANFGSNSISVLLNEGGGTFQTAVDYGTGMWPNCVFAIDLDGDSTQDLATANYGSGDVSVLLNNGDGTFQAAVDYAAGDIPRSIFAADFDGDGDNDLVTANQTPNDVSVLINYGDGTYQSAVDYDCGYGPSSVSAIDLDGDTDKDLVTANVTSNNVSILLNNGDGTFQKTTIDHDSGDDPSSVFAIDLDGDGSRDLVTANQGSDNVSIMLNDGNGNFPCGDWETVGAPMGDPEVYDMYIDPVDDCLWYITSDNGIYITRDCGTNWENHLGGTAAYTRGFAIDPIDPDNVFVWRPSGLYRSDDKGISWQFADSLEYCPSMLISPIDGAIFATSRPGVFRSYDDGQTWEFFSYDVETPFLIPWDIEEDPVNGILYIATEIGDHPQPYEPPFFRSMDRGETWEEISGELPWHVIRIQVHPETRHVYALTEGMGIYRSIDFGTSWHLLNNYFMLELLIDKNNPCIFYGGNHTYGNRGGGAYMSKDAGNTWESIGLSEKIVTSLALSSSSSKLHASSYASGIFFREFDSLDISCEPCCGFWTGGFTGNTDCSEDGKRNLADITQLISRVYLTPSFPLCCEESGNTNGDPQGTLNLSDITTLIDYVYISHTETAPCP